MKQIILDHFRRWWWVWAIGGVFYGYMTFGIFIGRDEALGVFPVGIFLGSFLLAMDSGRGHARALLALPVRSPQIARAWWLATVAIPAVALAVISGVAFGLAFLIHSKLQPFAPVLHTWLLNVLLLGVTFFFVTGLPSKGYGAGDWKYRARGAIFGALYGGTCGCWVFLKDLDFRTELGLGVLAIGALLTLLGWFRAEALVMERAGLRPSSSPPSKKSAAPSRCHEGNGGLLFLAQTLFTRMTLIGLAMFAMIFVMFALMMRHKVFDLSTNDFLGGSMMSMFTFQFLWMMSIQFFVFALHIRYLRVMPVAASVLAGLLVFVPLAAEVVVFCASVVMRSVTFHAPLPGWEELVRHGCLLQISSATIAVPLLIWRGLDLVNYLIGMAFLMGGIFATIFFNGRIPMTVNLAAAPLIMAGVYFATKMLLERNSHTYRPRTNQFGGWNLSGGR